MDFFEQIKETLKDREQHYGKTWDCHAGIARVWNEYLYFRFQNKPVTLIPKDVAMMMVLFKAIREAIKHKPDNLIDMAAYASFAHDFQTKLPSDSTPRYDSVDNHWGPPENLKPTDESKRIIPMSTGLTYFRDGNQVCCVDNTFINLQESIAGFGLSMETAFQDYKKRKHEHDNRASEEVG